jgi:hypothetical protein
MVGRAVLHVGAPKTGSTYLQGLLWRNRVRLREAGVDMLGAGQAQHYRAGKDLRGIPFDPADPGVDWTGEWERLATRAAASAAPTVVISDEHLAAVTPAQAQVAVRSLAPREVHVVYVTRDLIGVLPSEWQEFVKHGSDLRYEDWVRRVLASPDKRPGQWFWTVHDPASVARRWMSAMPASNVHVVAMPPPDAPRDELWRLVGSLLGVSPTLPLAEDVPSNTSLGPLATEVLRRVNEVLPPQLPPWHRTGLVRDVLANIVLRPLGDRGRPSLPADLTDDVLARAQVLRAELRDLGADLVGSFPPLPPSLPEDPRAEMDPDEITLVAVEAIAGLIEHMAWMRDDRRATERRLRREHRETLARFERRHPVATRIEGVRTRVAAAEQQYPPVKRALAPLRDLRQRRSRDTDGSAGRQRDSGSGPM